MTKCFCRCHSEPDLTDRAFPYAGVDVRDHVAAVLACKNCENAHCPAILALNAPMRRNVRVRLHDGREMDWAAYNREMQNRADSWKNQGDGENCA